MGALAGVPQQTYGEQEIENGLQALAVHAGNARVASELTGIPERTLRDWRNLWHTERYAEIRREIMPKIRQRLAAMHEDNAAVALEKAREVMDALDPSELSHSERAKATQQLAVASGVYTDKASILRGLPSIIEERASAEEVLRRLQSTAPTYVIDSTADEIKDAEVVSDDAQRTYDNQGTTRHETSTGDDNSGTAEDPSFPSPTSESDPKPPVA